MSVRSVPPTRSGLVRASAQLGRVQKGRELLNRKREALITELFKSARPALNARQEVEERASAAYRALLQALAARGQASLETYAWPGREITVELEHTPDLGHRRALGRFTQPHPANADRPRNRGNRR